MEYNNDLLLKCFNRFAKYLNDNNSGIIFKYENDKVKYAYYTDLKHNRWYDWYDGKDLTVFDIDLKDERLNFFIGKHDTFFSNPFPDEPIYQFVNKCINFLLNPTSLEDIAMRMDLMGI